MNRFEEAAKTLEQAAQAGKIASPGLNQLFLAAAQHRLGESPKAQKSYDETLIWRKATKQLSPFQKDLFDRAQVEVEKLLRGEL